MSVKKYKLEPKKTGKTNRHGAIYGAASSTFKLMFKQLTTQAQKVAYTRMIKFQPSYKYSFIKFFAFSMSSFISFFVSSLKVGSAS